MAKEPEFKKGQKGYLQRFVNIFQSDANIAINDFKTDSKSVISEVNNIKETLSTEVATVNENIKKLEQKESLLQAKLDEISEFYNSNFEENEDGIIISEEVDGYVEKFQGYKNEIDELKNEIDKYNVELFGSEDEDGNEIKGLEHKIESLKVQLQNSIKDSQEKLDAFLEKNEIKRDELFTKIEGLLKGASTVALAEAFNKHKKSFNNSNIMWMLVFVFSIISMMGLSIWGFINSNYEFRDMWKYTLGNLPFIGGAIWLAIYSSKQRSQNRRLQQEYAFKEDVAKIYYGLKQEIEELGESDLGIELNSKILETIISIVNENPSKTLDSNSHNDKGPILEGLNEVSNLIKEIKSPI